MTHNPFRNVPSPLLLIVLVLAAVLPPTFAHVTDSKVNVVHRLLQSDNANDAFTKRELERASPLPTPLDGKDWDTAIYQVALVTDDGTPVDISSVKACHLATASQEHFIVHLTSDNLPFSLDYHLSPVPRDGSCPPYTAGSSFSQIKNTTVRTSRPSSPPSPILRTPPVLTAQGEPVKPQPEKSFIQKYWLYIASALVFLLLAGGPPPEEEGQSGAQPAPASAPARR